MPILNNIREETVCKENRELLGGFASHELINEEGFIDLNPLELEQQKQIIKEIIKNEESNVIASKENYQKLKYKAKNTSELLVLALALIVAGLTLAPLFIASSIILPVLPVLFFGVAIIAITNLFLNRKINQLGINAIHADKLLNQLIKSSKGDGNDEEVSNDFSEQIREVKSATIAKNKIDEPATSYTSNLSELLVNQGTFSKTSPSSIPIIHDDPVNELHNRESTLNITLS